MNTEIFITIGGIMHIVYAIFHIFFWKIFDWPTELRKLSFINRNVMQILNLCLTFVFLIFAYISLFHTAELPNSSLGNSLIGLISIFWFLRASEQVYFFGLKKPLSLVLFGSFLFMVALYALPLMI